MNKALISTFSFLTIFACNPDQEIFKEKNETFTKELVELREFFHIPAISVIIKRGDQTVYENYIGLSDLKKKIPIDSTTTIPMASLTKIFSAILIMKLVEEDKLSMDDPINKYISNQSITDSIKIKHVLSHTSQGNIGDNFYYSSRFRWLTTVIEKASGRSFETEMNEKIIQPLKLNNTYLLSDSLQLAKENRKIAMPYYFEGEPKDGFIEYGYSASAGITSTVRDLAAFNDAIDNNSLISEDSKKKMFAPFKKNLPYGQGIFTQTFQHQVLIWGYGQYDCYSSLFLKVPEKDLTLIIAANNNLMSDPARLIYGDITYSLFAISFLKNYVSDLANEPLLEDPRSLSTIEKRITAANSAFYRKKLLAQSISESFMSMYDISKIEKSATILEKVFKLYPDYENYSHLSLLHNLNFLKTVAFLKKNESFSKFDTTIEKIAAKLLGRDRDNPYANYYAANYYSNKGLTEIANKFYSQIINAKNFSRNWYTSEAENWLKENRKHK